MDDAFKIFVEQLRDGRTETLHEVFPPDFLGVKEKDLFFAKEVTVDGQAYLAEDTLIMHCILKAYAMIPCVICNEPVEIEIVVDNFYHAEILNEIKGDVFNFSSVVRDAILLETPGLAECHQGHCPERKNIKKYLKSSEQKAGHLEDGYRPFADLS